MSSNSATGSGHNSYGFAQMDSAQSYGKCYDAMNELMRAIILRVIEDYNSGGELKDEALVYLNDTDEEYIFSFVSITKHLGLDPEKTKHMIMTTKRRISTRRRAA